MHGFAPLLVATAFATAAAAPTCTNATFPAPLAGKECWGLKATPTGPNGNPITDADGCASDCCLRPSCTIWNWKPKGGSGSAAPGCWTGAVAVSKCRATAGGWSGRGGRGKPPPPPPPPPCPSPAGTLALCPAPWEDPRPLPFTPPAANTRNPETGETFGADSKSLLLNGSRYYPVGGEVHLARLTEGQWEEQLMRMKVDLRKDPCCAFLK